MDAQNLKPSKKEWIGLYVPKHTAKLILQGIEDNSLPLLPKENGHIDVMPIFNANTGYILPAKDLIPAQITKVNNGYKSDVVGTKNTVDKAGTQIKEGEKGLFYNWQDENKQFHHSALFFAEQTTDPEKFLANVQIRQPQRLKDMTLKINSPGEYLPMYLAAAKSGAKLEVFPETVKEFKKQFKDICINEKTNSESKVGLHNVLFAADLESNKIIKNIEQARGIAPKKAPEKKIEKSIER
nr:hypothetical protein [Treponema socranskii]